MDEDCVFEEEIYDLQTLNNWLISDDNLVILNVNIRSLNCNFELLESFIIICTESWNISHIDYFSIQGYTVYYNHGVLNRADGVVMYIDNRLNTTHFVVEEVGNLKILTCNVNILNNILKISALYRCHDCEKESFISNLKVYLNQNKNNKSHIVMGDFNINILDMDNDAEEYLNNFFENGYLPYFNKITMPSKKDPNKGTCIDNVFVKSATANIKSFKFM